MALGPDDRAAGLRAPTPTIVLASKKRKKKKFTPPALPPSGGSDYGKFFGPSAGAPSSIRVDNRLQKIAAATAAALQRARAQQFTEQYAGGQNTSGGFLSNNLRDLASFARRDEVTLKEAALRSQAARATNSRLKTQYRSLGLYSGDASGEYDPLLKSAARLEQAQFQGEDATQAAAEQYGRDVKAQGKVRFQRTLRRAQHEAQNLRNIPGFSNFVKKAAIIGGDNAAYVETLLAKASDPKALASDPEGFIEAVGRLRSDIRADKEANPGGFKGFVTGALKDIGGGLGALQEQVIMQPYYAAKLAQNEGGGLGRQMSSFFSAMPGLGFTAGGVSKRDRTAVDSWDERQALTEQGRIQSFGKTLADALVPEQLRGAELFGFKPFDDIHDAADAPLDLTFTLVTDPLNALAPGASRAARVGELAGEAGARAAARQAGLGIVRRNVSDVPRLASQMADEAAHGLTGAAADAVRNEVVRNVAESAARARLSYLDTTKTGRALMAAAEEAVEKNLDSAGLSRAIRGLLPTVAQEMASASSKDEAIDILRRAFSKGEYNPSITLRRQAASALGADGITKAGGIGFGTKVIRTERGLFDVLGRSAARNRGVRSVVRASTVRAAEHGTLMSGLARAGQRMEDVYQKVATETVGLDVGQRLTRAWEQFDGNAGLEDLFEQGLRKAEKEALAGLGLKRGTATLKDLDAVAATEDFQGWLKQVEVIGHLAAGKEGQAAAQQVARDAKFGLGRKAEATGNLLGRALAGTATPPVRLANDGLPKDELARYLSAHIEDHIGDVRIQSMLLDEVERAAGKKGLGTLRKLENRVEALIKSPAAQVEFQRLLRAGDELVGAAEEALPSAGLMRRLANQPVKLVNSLVEPVAPAKVAFLGYADDAYARAARVEGTDRWFSDLGFDATTRSILRTSAERVTSEDDLFKLVDTALSLHAAREGVPEELLTAINREGISDVKAGRTKVTRSSLADGSVSNTGDVQLLAQRGEVIYLPDPEDIRRTIREYRSENLSGHYLAKGRVAAAKVADAKLFGLKGLVSGDDLTLRTVFQKIHRKWKYLTVVPGLELAAMGAVVGFTASGGSIENRLKNAGAGASIGLLTPLRYVLRVAGTEEGLRKYISEGLNPEAFKPHLSRFATQQGLDRPFTLGNAVKAGDPIGLQHQRLLETAEKEWSALLPASGKNPVVKVFRRDARYIKAYGRVLNNQIHPETDAVVEMLLRKQAGEMTVDEVAEEFARFIESPAGKLWLRRFKGGYGGPKSADEAFARASSFIEDYVPDAEVARARLDLARDYAVTGAKKDVDVAVLKAAQRRNALPEVIHAENTFRIPRNFRDVALLRERLTSVYAFEGPTTALNRIPMAKAIYRDEYERLLLNGVDAKRAQALANQEAVARTNRVMFRIDDESRFAAKSDYVFPFQQPREELLRVWAPLIGNNKARAAHVGNVIAKAFNNGEDKGLFTKDQYGNWRMTVPGSAWLSQKLFGSSDAFAFNLRDLVFFGQGAYNVNVIPSPGGPYWSAAVRLFINRNADWYANLDGWQREWLFPYGANGRIFRPEVSRMWQSWTGEPAPFEFASRMEQEDALAKHRHDVFLQLMWQHAKSTGDWSGTWQPTPDELDKAVSASLRAWAFFGSWFPAGPQRLRPDQAAFDAARAAYTDAQGNFDRFGFLDEFPFWEPWLISNTERINDDGFEDWAKNWSLDDTTLHNVSRKSFTQWHAEMKEAQRTSQAYREKGDLRHIPDPADRYAAYAAWDRKYPDLVDKAADNYERDIELMQIEGTLIGAAKDRAVDLWRKRYDVKFTTYQALVARLNKGELRSNFDPWDSARTMDTVVQDVQSKLRRTHGNANDFDTHFEAEAMVVRDLPVVEQIKYWQWRLNNFTYDWTDDPQLVLDRYDLVKKQLNGLWQTGPMQLDFALNPKKQTPFAKLMAAKSQNTREEISEHYRIAFDLDAQMDSAAQRKDWKTYYALKPKRQFHFDAAKELKNEWYKGDVDIDEVAKDVLATVILTIKGDKEGLHDLEEYRKEFGFFVHSDEESKYLKMPSEVRQAFIDDLVNGLEKQPAFEGAFTEGRMFWEWLTEFQQDVLRKNVPAWKIRQWEGTHPEEKGSGSGSGGRGGRGFGGYATVGAGGVYGGELSYAFAMFKKYNQRGGMAAPAAYKEYLTIASDAALRTAFLRRHPEVADYISKGPMANMPPSIAVQVADIMIRSGKWEGEPHTPAEISEIGFAKEMLLRFNLRGDRQAPGALEAWTNMPTGPEKAAYLRAHPEIGEWMKLGPMANMPEAYREVVRDIMTRYGFWTAGQDPLGQVISGYFSTPGYARDKYLEAHPELVEYWKTTRTPEEQRLFSMSDTYFSIKDPTTQRAYLQMHPELQQFFLDRRQARYERFLNQVAIYMGSNPELFTKYLDRQEEVLSDLLHKFSEAPVMRERFMVTGPTGGKKRQRDAA